jgi:hypothetical protein
MEPRDRFQGMNSANLCSPAGWYDNPTPTRFLAPIDCLKIPALILQSKKTVPELTMYNSLYLIVNSVVSYPPLPQRERVGWRRSLLLVEHTYICLLISKTTNRKRRSTEPRREGVRADLMSLSRHFIEHGTGHWENPCLS